MIIRSDYMNTLKTYRDVPLVKILAGIRRCGKSTILDMLRDCLLYTSRQRAPLAFEKLRNGIGRKGLAHVFHDILYNTIK